MKSKKHLFIHYGANKYDASIFKSVVNRKYPSNKPKNGTGLWASPVSSIFGWKEAYVAKEMPECKDFSKHFVFNLNKDARIFKIESEQDLDLLPKAIKNIEYPMYGLDFEKIKQMYDVIHLTKQGVYSTQYTHTDVELNGWDCECILVLNKDIVECLD